MTRKTSGPREPKNGAGGRHSPDKKSSANGADKSRIIDLTSTPAFDLWLERQTKRIVDASSRRPGRDLVDLIRAWSPNNPKKGPGKITD